MNTNTSRTKPTKKLLFGLFNLLKYINTSTSSWFHWLIVDVQNVKLLMTPAFHFTSSNSEIHNRDIWWETKANEWFRNYHTLSILNQNRTVLIITRKCRNIFSVSDWSHETERETEAAWRRETSPPAVQESNRENTSHVQKWQDEKY